MSNKLQEDDESEIWVINGRCIIDRTRKGRGQNILDAGAHYTTADDNDLIGGESSALLQFQIMKIGSASNLISTMPL